MEKKTVSSILAVFLIALSALQPVYAQSGTDVAYLIEIAGTSFLPSTIYAGDVVSLAVDVKDKGNYLSIVDLQATLDVGSQFEPIKVEGYIPLILRGTTKTLVFQFRAKEDTLPGYYPALVTMSYLRGDTEITATETQSITIPVSKTEKNLDVTIEPKVINPGNQTEFTFTIKNVGGAPASNIAFSWEEENDLVLPIGSDNKRYVSYLKGGEEASVSYIVAADPNIATGIYPLDVTMTFTDIDGTVTQESQVGLIVGGTTDFEVSAEALSTGQVSISIANIGSNNADAVVVRVPEQQGISISGSNASILGNLNKGDFTLANFEMRTTAMTRQTPETLPTRPTTGNEQDFGRRTLLLQIEYTDTTGERQNVEKQLVLNFVASETGTMTTGFAGRQRGTAQNNSLTAWALLAILVGGAAAYNKFKAGNRKWKKLGKVLAPIAVLFLVVIFLLGSSLVAAILATVVSVLVLGWFFREKHTLRLLDKAATYAKKYME